MRRHLLLSFSLVLPAWSNAAAQSAGEEAEEAPSYDWVQLFDGNQMSGLVVDPSGQSNFVTIEDEVIRIRGSRDGGWLRTERKYDDFTMEFEIRFLEGTEVHGGSPHGNNGLILRSPEISKSGRNWPGRGFEMELWDQSKRGGYIKNGTLLGLQPGAPNGRMSYDIAAAHRADRPTGEWMTATVIADGDHIWTKLNGEWLSTAYDVPHPDGHVGFQIEDGVTEIRNLRIREHGPDTITPNTIVPLFKSGQLSGLSVADPQHRGNVSIADGLLRLAGPGGWLRTEHPYTDYTLRLEFRTMTPDANSGVYVRQRGSGTDESGWPINTDEVQILSQRVPPPTAAAGDPRWFGALLSRGTQGGRGLLDTGEILRAWRGVGEWQEAVFEVQGGNVKVSLNGVEISEGSNLANAAEGGFVGLEIGPGVTEFRTIEINGFRVDG